MEKNSGLPPDLPFEAADPRIRLVGRTEFVPPVDVEFDTDAEGGQALAEFAGRACYQSWDKPIPATATNAGYLRHIIEVGHLSILEHSSATFYLTGISRSVAHEIIRHRHFSCTELSPRYAAVQGMPVIVPSSVRTDPILSGVFGKAASAALAGQAEIVEALSAAAAAAPDGTLARKQARQAAQALFPGAVATALVVTGNYRSWRHFIGMRATDPADTEIRGLAVGILTQLQALAPHVFADFRISQLPDGTQLAASPLVGEG